MGPALDQPHRKLLGTLERPARPGNRRERGLPPRVQLPVGVHHLGQVGAVPPARERVHVLGSLATVQAELSVGEDKLAEAAPVVGGNETRDERRAVLGVAVEPPFEAGAALL